jgi:hypothetical protein
MSAKQKINLDSLPENYNNILVSRVIY